jgi:hypothetical protein
MSSMSEDKERRSGIAGVIWALEHVQDLLSVIVGVLLVALAVAVLVLGIVDFFRDVTHGAVESAVINLLNRALAKLRYSPYRHESSAFRICSG